MINRVETRMIGSLLECRGEGRRRNHRKLLKGLLTSSANHLPERGILWVQVHGLGNDAMDRILEPLFQALNETRIVYPGTNLTMVYEAKGNRSSVTHWIVTRSGCSNLWNKISVISMSYG